MTAKQISYTKIIIIFYILFLIISLCGYFIIDYTSISLITIVLFFLFISFLIYGSLIGERLPRLALNRKININTYILLVITCFITLTTTLIGWKYIIDYYGSLAYVLAHGTLIRDETIGDGIQLKPTIISYISSISNVGLPLSLSAFYFHREKKYIWLAVAYYIIIILGDLQTFGRIGMLFGIFCIIGYIILCIKKIPYLKYTLYSFSILVIFMLPKFIRSGNTIEGIGGRYAPYLINNINPIFEPFVTLYAYYFSGIYAFDYLLEHFQSSFYYGLRNLSAVYNLLNKLFEFQETRNSIIADVAYVPFDTNIYTLAGELYMDFGVLGIVLGSLFFGVIGGYLFKYNGIFGTALKFVLFAWLLETPIYNVFSFGGFFLAFIILVFLTLFCNDTENIYHHS